jgi:hypothetical protein
MRSLLRSAGERHSSAAPFPKPGFYRGRLSPMPLKRKTEPDHRPNLSLFAPRILVECPSIVGAVGIELETAYASVGGGPAPAIVLIHDLRIGDATLEGLIAAAMPLSGLLNGEDAPRGILSAAVFPGYLLTYDYPGKRILIKKGALEAADSRSIFQYAEDQILPTVPVSIAGHNLQVHLDTGSPFGLVLPVKFLTELPLASQPREAGRVRTGGGEFSVSSARVDGTIELGKYKLDPGEVRFSDARPGPGPSIGNLGYEVLWHFVVTLDSQNRRIKIDQ